VQPIVKAISDAFKPRYANITVTAVALGDDAGYSKLCTNGLDLIGATRLLTDAEKATCQKANVQTMGLQVGINAVVIVVNGNNKFATCLTTDQLGKIFGVDSQGKVKKWSDVSSDFPSTDLTILTPEDGAQETDLLLDKSIKKVAPVLRTDVTEQKDDALYRAAATQNVAGAITYMTFADFQKVKSNVHPVAVNAGNGCVDPTEANLKNNTYPLAEPLYIVLNMNTFNRADMKAFVWYLLSDDALTVIGKQNVAFTDTAGFSAARDSVLARFSQAATPQATAAATQSATTAPTAESTAAK
jgi:phosphate transport system substrate-binding protein